MQDYEYFWNCALNKTKSDDSFYLNGGVFINAYRILKEGENWWFVMFDKESYCVLPDDDYMFWKAENWSTPFFDW